MPVNRAYAYLPPRLLALGVSGKTTQPDVTRTCLPRLLLDLGGAVLEQRR